MSLFRKPVSLNSLKKWYKVVRETNSAEKFYILLNRILDDKDISLAEFWVITKCLVYDINKYHKNTSITSFFSRVDELLKASFFIIEKDYKF